MSNELIVQNNITSLSQWSELTTRADYLAKSELIPSALRGKPSSVAVILQIGCELGISPMQALNGVSVIQGRPGVDPQLAIALIRQRVPGAVIKVETIENPLTVKVTMARSREFMDEGYTASWDMKKAKDMQLDKKDNYIKQPATMLRWRAAMEAARFVFPDVIKGMYSDDELDGLPPQEGADDKVSRLQEKLAAAKEVKVEVKPEPVEIVGEDTKVKVIVKPKEPVIEPKESFDPISDYEIKVTCPLKGQRLSKIPVEVLENFSRAVQDKSAKVGKSLTGDWLETILRIEEFLNSLPKKQSEPVSAEIDWNPEMPA